MELAQLEVDSIIDDAAKELLNKFTRETAKDASGCLALLRALTFLETTEHLSEALLVWNRCRQ